MEYGLASAYLEYCLLVIKRSNLISCFLTKSPIILLWNTFRNNQLNRISSLDEKLLLSSQDYKTKRIPQLCLPTSEQTCQLGIFFSNSLIPCYLPTKDI